MTVHLVRHACAGFKEEWDGADELRPLDIAGVAQASQLVDAFAGRRITRLVSSPLRRCVQTLVPLARDRALPVDLSPALAKDADVRPRIDLVLDPASDGTVLCTHGENLEPLLGWLFDLGLSPVDDDVEAGVLLSKGTVWALDIVDGVPVSWEHLVPRDIQDCRLHPSFDQR